MLPAPSPVAANILSTLGAVAWSIQLIPQIILNYRRHHATGLQPSMMLLWSIAGVPLGVYNIVSKFPIALLVQPQILTALSLITLSQCLYYSHHWSIKRCIAQVGVLAVFLGATQVALVFALESAASKSIEWPLTMMAVLSALLLAAGVGAHYIDIWKTKSVRGISFLFVGIDAAGDLFSLLSLLWRDRFDVLGSVIYGVELAMWLGVMGCGIALNLLPWAFRRFRSRIRAENYRPDIVALDLGQSREPERVQGGDAISVFRTASGDDQAGENLRQRTGHQVDIEEFE